MELDPVFLSRLQFVWVIALHILLPAFTMGLSCFIALLESAHLVTKNPVYLRLSQFWLRIFAVSFGLGVVSGIVTPFQFGTNWSRYSDAATNIVPTQILLGDQHGVNTLQYQPIKVAAMEGNWHRQSHAPLLLFALPDQEAAENRYELGSPGLASLILAHNMNGEIPGLTEVPPEDRPPVAIVFWARSA